MTGRRDFLVSLGAVLGWSVAARAQQKAIPVIGFLGNATAALTPWITAFRRGLDETGYIEGKNVRIEYRWAEARYDRLPALAADLVNRKVDVIVAAGTPGIQAAKSATSTIPIVSIGPGDELVAAGLIASLARPGGNLTGVSIMSAELDPKRLDLLSELVPEAKAIAFIENPTRANAGSMTENVQKAARAKGMQLVVVKAGNEAEIDATFGDLAQLHGGCGAPRRLRSVLQHAARTAGDACVAPRHSSYVPMARVRRGRRPGQLRIEPHGCLSPGWSVCGPDTRRC